MGKCSEEVLNKIREELKSSGAEPETIDTVVSLFEKSVETDASADLVSKTLTNSLFTTSDIEKLNKLISKFRRAKGDITKVTNDDLSEFTFLWSKWQAYMEGKVLIAEGFKTKETLELKKKLRKLESKFLSEGKIKEARTLNRLIRKIEATEKQNRNAGRFIRNIEFEGRLEKTKALLNAVNASYEFEASNNETIKKLNNTRFALVGELQRETDPEKKKEIQKKIDENVKETTTKTNEILLSKAFRKQQKADSTGQISLYEAVKELSSEIDKNSSTYRLALNELIDSRNTLEHDKQLFELAKQGIQVLNTSKALLDAIRKEKGGKVTVAELKAVIGDLGVSIDQLIIDTHNKVNPKEKAKSLKGSTELDNNTLSSIFNTLANLAIDQAFSNGIALGFEFSPEDQMLADNLKAASNNMDIENEDQVNNDTVMPKARTASKAKEETLSTREQKIKAFKEGTDFKKLYVMLKQALERVETLRKLPQFSEHMSRDMVLAALGPQLHLLNPDIYFSSAVVTATSVARLTAPALSSLPVPPALEKAFANLGMDPRAIKGLPEVANPDEYARNWDKVISFDIETKGDEVFMISIRHSATEERLDPSIEQLVSNPAKGSIGNFTAYSKEDLLRFLRSLELMQNMGWKVAGFNNVEFDLARIAKSIGTEEASNLAARVALRSYDMYAWIKMQYGATVNLDNLATATLGRGKIKGVTGTSVVDLLLAAKTEEETSKALEYSRNDSDLVFEIIENLRSNPSRNLTVNVNNVDKSTVNLSLSNPLQTWQLAIFHSNTNSNFNGFFKEYNATGVQPAINNFVGESSNAERTSRLLFNTEAVRDQLLLHMSLSLRADPDTAVVGETLIKEAERLTKKEQEVLVTQMKLMRTHRQAGIEAKKALLGSGGEPKFILSIIEGEPKYIEATTSTTAESQYEAAVIEAFNQFYLDMAGDRVPADQIVSRMNEKIVEYGFREKTGSETQADYIKAFINEVILPSVKAKAITDFGNGNTDYAPAWNVGYAIAQIAMGRRDGIMDSRFIEEQAFVTPLSTMNDLENNAKNLSESLKVRHPHRKNVSMFAPISLKQYEEVYNDWALRQRINHILNGDRYKGLSEEELRKKLADIRGAEYMRRVSVLAKSTTIIPDITPTVNNRQLFNELPTIEDTLDRTLETLLDLPAIGVAVVHDSVFLRTKVVVDNDGKSLKFSRLEASPGAWSARSIINGQLVAQLGWYQTYGITDGAIQTSLEETAKGIQAGKLQLKNIDYFDFDFNGVHHMLMLMLAYNIPNDVGTRGVANLIKNLNLSEWWSTVDANKDDFYTQVSLQVQKNIAEQYVKLSERKQTAPLTKDEQAKFDSLEKWNAILNSMDETGSKRTFRDFFKAAVLPRLYQGGIPSISQALFEKTQDPEFKETFPSIVINNADIGFLLKDAEFSGVVGLIKLIDETINISVEGRTKLKQQLDEWNQKLFYKDGVQRHHAVLKEMGKSTDFGRGIIDDTTLTNLINLRIDAAARMLVKPSDIMQFGSLESAINNKKQRLAKLWADRINAGREYVRTKGGTLTTRGEYIKLAEIMGRDPQAWKDLPLLAAINTANRTPLKIREEAIREATEEFGVNVNDYLGNSGNYLFFQSLARDLAGGRMYTTPSGISYQGPSYSQVATPSPFDPADVDTTSLWEIDEFSFARLAKENPEEARRYITQLVLQQYELRLATEYMANDYNDKTLETPERFLEDWSRISKKEREFYARRRSIETLRTAQAEAQIDSVVTPGGVRPNAKNWIKEARKRGLLLEQGLRYLASPSRVIGDTSKAFEESNQKMGIFAFRPKTADIDITDLPIYALAELAIERRIDKENENWVRASKKNKAPSSVTDIIPEQAIGYTHTVNPESLPYVPRELMSLGLLTNLTDVSTKLAVEQARIQSRLYRFAKQNGLMHLLPRGRENWAAVHFIRMAHVRGGYPLLRKLGKVYNADENTLVSEYNLGVSKFLTSMFDIIEYQHNTMDKDVTQLDFNYFGGFNPKMFKGMRGSPTYYNLLTMLSDASEQLGSLKYGLTVSSRTRVAGPDSQPIDENTRTLPVTVQAMDAVNLVFILYNLTKVKQVATELVKARNIAGVEFDPAGQVIPESIPANAAVTLLPEILSRPEFTEADIRSVGLYVLYNEYQNTAELVVDKPTANTMDIQTAIGPVPQVNVNDGKTKYAFTPEMLNSLLLALRNSVVLNQAELAYATNKSIGEKKSNLERGNLQRTLEYYNGARELKADEATVFSALHAGLSPLYTLDGGMYDARYNVQYEILDSIRYLAKENFNLISTKYLDRGSTPFTVKAYELALLMPLQRAIAIAENNNLKSALNTINSTLNNNPQEIRQLLPIISLAISKPTMELNAIKALVDYTFSREGISKARVDALTNDIQILLNVVRSITDPQSNEFYTPVRAFLQRLDVPTDKLNELDATVQFIAYQERRGKKLNAEQQNKVRLAVSHSIKNLQEDSQLSLSFYGTGPKESANKFGNETIFLSTFVNSGEQLNNQIKSLGLDALTEQMYRAMIGFILHKHPELEGHLTISIDDVEGNRLAKIRKVNDVFNIVFAKSPNTIKAAVAGKTTEQAIEVIAHELSHIALNYSKIRDRIGYEEAIESLMTDTGQEAIEKMVTNAFAGGVLTRNEITKLVSYYQQNLEEALVMWGSQMLITRAMGKDRVELKAIEEENNIASKVNSWWKRTFKSIEYFVNNLVTFLDEMTGSRFVGVSDKVNRVFNGFFDATSDLRMEDKAVYDDVLEESFIISNADVYYNPGSTSTERTAYLEEQERNQNQYRRLTQELSTLDPNSAEYARVKRELDSIRDKWQNNVDHLGISDELYYDTLTRLRNRNDVVGREFDYAETTEEEIVLADHIIRKLSEVRGKRVDSPGTAAYLTRQMMNLFSGTVSMQDDGHARNRLIQTLQKISTSVYLVTGNQSGQTYNSAFGIIVSLAHLIDAEAQTVDSYFEGNGGLDGIKQNQYQVNLLVNQVSSVYNQIVSEFSSAIPVPGATNRSGDIILESFSYLASGKIDPSFNEKEQAAIRRLGDTYRKSSELLHGIITDANLKDRSRPFHDSYLAFKLDIDQFREEKNKAGYQTRRTQFIQSVSSLIKAKQLSQLQDLDRVHPVTFMLTSGLPTLKTSNSSDMSSEQEFISFIERNASGSTNPNSVEAIIFNSILSYAAQVKEGSVDLATKKDLIRSGATVGNSVALKDLKKGYKALLEASTSRTATVTGLLTAHTSGITPEQVKIIQNAIKNTITSDIGNPPNMKAKLQAMRSERFPIKIKEERNIFSASTNTIPELLAIDFLNTIGSSAAITYKDDINLTVDDIFGDNFTEVLGVEEMRSIRSGFSRDIRSIIKSIGSGLGQQAVSSSLIYKMTGVQGYDVLKLIRILKAYVDGANRPTGSHISQGQFERTEQGVRAKPLSQAEVKLLSDALTVLEHKYQYMWNMRSAVSGDAIGKNAIKFTTQAAHLIWGGNQIAAGILVDSSAAAVGAMMLGGAGGVLGFYGRYIGDVLRLSFGAFSDGWKQTQVRGDFADFAEIFWDTNSNFVESWEKLYGEVDFTRKTGRLASRFLSFNQALNMSTSIPARTALAKTALVQLNRQLNTNNLEEVRRMLIDGELESANYRGYVTLMKKLKNNGFRKLSSPETILRMKAAGMFEVGVIESLKFLKQSGPISTSKYMEKILDLDKDFSVNVDGVVVNKQMLIQAVGSIEKFQDLAVKQSLVSSSAFDGITDDSPLSKFLSLYRSYSILFAGQMLLRNSARMSTSKMAGLMLVYTITDIMYQTMLAVASGFLAGDEIERLLRGEPSEKVIKLIAKAAVRNPMFTLQGNFLLDTSLFLADTVAGNKGLEPEIAPLGVTAMVRLLKNLATNTNTFINAQSDEERIKSAYNGGLYLLPILNQAWFKTLINQGLATEAKKQTMGSFDSGRRNSEGRPMNTAFATAYAEYENMQLPTPNNIAQAILKSLYQTEMNNKLQQYMHQFKKKQMPNLGLTAPETPVPEKPVETTSTSEVMVGPKPSIGSSLQKEATTPIKAPDSLK